MLVCDFKHSQGEAFLHSQSSEFLSFEDYHEAYCFFRFEALQLGGNPSSFAMMSNQGKIQQSITHIFTMILI